MTGRRDAASIVPTIRGADRLDAREILKSVPFFADTLGESELALLAGKSHLAFFRAGTSLMSREDLGTAMYVLVSGQVAVELHGGRHDRHIIRLGPGEIVGEMALFTGARRSATVTAETNVEALEIPKAALERVLARAPGLVDRFGEVFAARSAERREIEAEAEHFHPEEFGRQVRAFFAGVFGEGKKR
ncbi:MAG TPA: cyclic nucleotide-binding domain-containing protein [Arenibaculum sp.]|nr:cyclic nucleotide-binding domain-containing protein [Arenibaculum sp.]